jgi:uncharacterized protein (TIGR04255 family)
VESPKPKPIENAAPVSLLDYSEEFPHLRQAPVVEAVLDFRAPTTARLEEAALRAQLAAKLPDYPDVGRQRIIQSTFAAPAGRSPEASARDLGFIGVTCRTPDHKQVAQFHKDGFLFSRLHPYTDWQSFLAEALRLWKLHLELAEPEEIKRIGVRFINRMEFPLPCARLQDYLTVAPVNPPELKLPGLATFFHQELRLVPDTPYAINLVRTMQPVEQGARNLTLILDVDVFMEGSLGPRDPVLPQHLRKMRWLKNKAFFASLTANAVEHFQ